MAARTIPGSGGGKEEKAVFPLGFVLEPCPERSRGKPFLSGRLRDPCRCVAAEQHGGKHRSVVSARQPK